jgi:hypothetical protein
VRKAYPVIPPGCKWKIISEMPERRFGGVTYLVECSCRAKTRKVLRGTRITNGYSFSCGCLAKERRAANRKMLILPPSSRWRVISAVDKHERNQRWYLVECTCPARTRAFRTYTALAGSKPSLSCGCLNRKWPVLPPMSRWTILREAGRCPKRSVTYYVECSCSSRTRRVVPGTRLTSGESMSCGCLQRENAARSSSRWPILPPESKWRILRHYGRNERGFTYEVECSCEKKTRRVKLGSDLTAGSSLSCGCLRIERLLEAIKNRVSFSQVIDKYGRLITPVAALDRIEQEIKPCVSDSTNPTNNPRRARKTRSSAGSSTG